MRLSLILLTSAMLVLCSCSSDSLFDEPSTPNTSPEQVPTVNKISPEDAINIALDFMKGIETPQTRSESRKVAEIKALGTKSITRSENTDTLLYLINFEDEQGFALVGADIRALPIYAISDTGNFDITDKNSEIIGSLLDGAKSEVLANPILPPGNYNVPWPNFKGWNSDIDYRIEPILTPFQRTVSPYGVYSSKCTNAAGQPALTCSAAIATEQLMAYHKYADYFHIKVDWDQLNDGSSPEAVASLIKTIGSYLELEYVDSNTLARFNLSSLVYGLGNLQYYKYGDDTSSDFIFNNKESVSGFLQGYGFGPIMMIATNSQRDEARHVWLIDGMVQYKVNVNENFVVGTPPSYIYPCLYHCVWGFENGACNGYYHSNLYKFVGAPCYKDPSDTDSNSDYDKINFDESFISLFIYTPNAISGL